MTERTPNLYDDLYYEIFNLLIDWIWTNNINYGIFIYRELGYFPYYEKDDSNKVPSNWFAWWHHLKWNLLDPKLEKRINEESNPYLLAFLEDEKLTTIHDKILTWYEQHRLHPKFNKPASNKKRCYRPTQYKNASFWLYRSLGHKLLDWLLENNIHFTLKYYS